MTRRTRRYLSLLTVGAFVVLVWPAPAGADTSLGGYDGLAQAEPIRLQIYEPIIPIPSTPQIDGGIGYTKSTTDTGPVARATASYFWPGDTVGDGFGQLTGNQSDTYPVQVNSRYPATASSPANNTAQLTTGNGMTTSSNGLATKATVTGLGIAGPDVNLLGGIGQGLGQLSGSTASAPAVPQVPLPVSSTLAALATVENMKSISSVVVGAKTVTSSAQAYMSQVKLLGGLVSLDGIDVTSQSVSDGTKATVSGQAKFGGITIAGQSFALDQNGFELGGSAVKLPAIPAAVTSLLAQLGISISYLQTQHQVSGATGSFESTALQITIDTNPLKNLLNVGALVGPLQQLLEQIPQLGSQLAPLLGIGPKIVLYVGNVQTSSTAAPGYGGGGSTAPGGTGTTTPTGGGGSGAGTGTSGDSGGGGGLTGGSLPGGTGGTGTTPGTVTTPSGGRTPTALQPTSFDLPALGSLPRMLLFGGIVLAGLVGWLFRALGGFLLGGARTCRFGLPSGVPDLRKG